MSRLMHIMASKLKRIWSPSVEATDTAGARSHARHRRIFASTGAAAAAKLITVCTQLVSVPLTLHYLGAERYGMWLTISSFIAILSFADLGMGNGLLTRVASAHGKDDQDAIRRYVSSSFFAFILIAAVFTSAFLLSYRFVAWQDIFNVKEPASVSEAGPAIAVFAICFALSIPANLVQKVQTGLQNGFIVSIWNSVGSLLALAGVLVATHLKLSLPWLVLSFVGAPLLVNILNSLVFFLFLQKSIAPRASDFSMATAVEIAKTGILFFVLQIVVAVAYSSDSLIISHILGPASVQQYAVPERMFSIVGMIIAMGLSPLWPAYGEAMSRGDYDWVRNTLWRSLGLAAGIAALGSISVALAGPTLLHLWVGKAVVASPLLLLGLAIWKIIEASSNALAMFLNGAHVVKFQLIVASITGAATLAFKILLISHLGVVGTIWGSILAYAIFAALPYAFRLRALLSEFHGKAAVA